MSELDDEVDRALTEDFQASLAGSPDEFADLHALGERIGADMRKVLAHDTEAALASLYQVPTKINRPDGVWTVVAAYPTGRGFGKLIWARSPDGQRYVTALIDDPSPKVSEWTEAESTGDRYLAARDFFLRSAEILRHHPWRPEAESPR